MITRNEMLDALRQGLCTVTFTKVNGEERVMDCTLRADMIPEEMLPKGDDNLDLKEGLDATISVIRTYDVRAAGWRSFRVENVTNFVQ
jgi:hypothetical protein